ncbi:MAG: hypothetical protein V4472_25450 [Pseudomonadota bacterium]
MPAYTYRHIAGAAAAGVVSPTPVVLHTVVVNAAATSVTLNDSATVADAGASNEIAAIGTGVGTFTYDAQLVNGLVVTVVGSGADVTITLGPAAGNLNLASA